ncbi:MAG: phosphoribosylglycinamide formyltransferase [Ilyomonas sp.]
MRNKKRIAIFASGAGSNAKKIIEYFNTADKLAIVTLVVCNKPGAGVIDIAKDFSIKTILLDKEKFFRGDHYMGELRKAGIDLIVLAGFLWKIPSGLIEAYKERIINIHPALLPKYGGKGMYGNFVHEAVLAAGDTESGITIHVVDELYDHGKHIFQKSCQVLKDDTAQSLAERIHALEHNYFPQVIEDYIKTKMLGDDEA